MEEDKVKMSLGLALLIFFIIILIIAVIIVYILKKDKIADNNANNVIKSNVVVNNNVNETTGKTKEKEKETKKDTKKEDDNKEIKYQKIYTTDSLLAGKSNYIINSLEEYEELKEMLTRNNLDDYTEDFFENKSLAVVFITVSSSAVKTEEKIAIVDDTVYADYQRINTGETGLAVMGQDILIIEVDKNVTKIESNEFIVDPLP